MLQCLGLIVFLYVNLTRLPVYALNFHIGFQACFLHLEQHQPSGKCYGTYIVAGGCLHRYYVALLKRQLVGIEIETFSGVFELHLNHIRIIFGAGYAFQIIEGVELPHVPAASLTADSTTSGGEYIIVHSLLF